MSVAQAKWHGIRRERIPWFPTVDREACIGRGGRDQALNHEPGAGATTWRPANREEGRPCTVPTPSWPPRSR